MYVLQYYLNRILFKPQAHAGGKYYFKARSVSADIDILFKPQANAGGKYRLKHVPFRQISI